MDYVVLGNISITDDDIRWVEGLLGLSNGSFDDIRSAAIKEMNSKDVQSCPGSGKTTLLIAKLAILATKLKSKTQGLCVLSHTNVARQEIENKLGKYKEGKQLISYPNFIGTIHSFIYEFIALPWIKSKGWGVNVIDTNFALDYRYNQLPYNIKNARALETVQEINYLELAKAPNVLKKIKWGGGYLGVKTDAYKTIQKILLNSFQNGIFTYGELVLFSEEALGSCCCILDSTRRRFPLVFIDEAQDNSEQQNILLSLLFPKDNDSICRQRFGDGNQAIFSSVVSQAASTDVFPAEGFFSIGSSKRLSCEIARLSDPLGLKPYSMEGQAECPIENKHTVFVYNDETITDVLPTFGDLILDSQGDISQGCYAIGMVHNSEKEKPIGAHVRHYWSQYAPEYAISAHNSNTLIENIYYARSQLKINGTIKKAVDIIAKSILNFIKKTIEIGISDQTSNSLRQLTKVIEQFHGDVNGMKNWIQKVLFIKKIDKTLWEDSFVIEFLKILNETQFENEIISNDYLEWVEHLQEEKDEKSINVYKHEKDGKYIEINLGSIHSVKGQTHFATLVLDTYWYTCNLPDIIEWLTGCNKGLNNAGRKQTRLKCHYVAMTRPKGLLCLAIHKQNLTADHISKLKEHGWTIKEL